jgi:4-hydroxy-tetrahydrodipicolinate synthase
VIEMIVECAGSEIPVVAGTAAAGTELTIALSKAAESAGVDGVQVVLPYYHVPSEEGLVAHYLRLADALGIGIMIYNNPVVSKLWMPPHLMVRCAEHPNIVADKEDVGDVTLYKAMRDAVDPAKMSVLCGLGDLQFAYEAALGCPAFVSWTANFAPELSLQLLEAADACDFYKVREVIAKVGLLYEFASVCARNRVRDPWVLPGFTTGHVYVGILKVALQMMGLAGGPVRGLGDNLVDGERKQLRGLLAEAGVLN